MQQGMVIIGAGEAGARAASALREEGWAGAITLIGEEIHAPYERPPLSKAALLDDIEPSPRFIGGDMFGANGVEHIGGIHVVAIDRAAKQVTLSDGRVIGYTKLLLATGARPRLPPIFGAQSRHCVTLRRFEDALALRRHLQPGKRIAIIGGGFIGLELAASARQRGAEVTIIEALPRLLSRGVPSDIAHAIQVRHEMAGVVVLCGDGIEGIEGNDEYATVILTNGTRIEADLIVVGVGAIPNVELAQSSALAIDNGIAVDGLLRTEDPDIHAAGDCCSFPLPIYGDRRIRLEAWRNAQEHGKHAAKAMLGHTIPLDTVPWFWSDQYDLSLQVAGLMDESTDSVRRDGADGSFVLFHLAADGRLVAASGLGPGNSVARDIRLAEMLIARRAYPDPAQLACSDVRLKSLLVSQD